MSMSRLMGRRLGTTGKGTMVAATPKNRCDQQRREGVGGEESSPSDLTESLLLLLSMEGWVMEAECVCGEFLWATADIVVR